jgi:hypothetical protein
MKAYNMNIGLNSHLWWLSPFVCLGIGCLTIYMLWTLASLFGTPYVDQN